MEDIVNIVKREIIDKMAFKLEVKSISGNLLTVCNPKWARVGGFITDEANLIYKIVDVQYFNESGIITLEGNFLGQNVFLKMPIYLFGTPLEVNSEWGLLTKIEKDKIPFIWLVLPTREVPFNRESSVERESELRIIFVDNRLVTNWKVKDIHKFRVQPLLNMVEEFKKVIEKNTKFKTVTDYAERVLDKLGSESEKGFIANIIDANLTAVELRLSLPIYKGSKCNC